jgi:C4-dicarboxylate transporter DctM subunit
MGLPPLGHAVRGVRHPVFPSVFYAAIAKYTLLAIPVFILAGIIMVYAGISRRLIDFANACCGDRKGGLAVVTIVVACFFAAISGSGPATVAAIGGVLIPAMVRNGYEKNFATAIVASAGGIGMVIPPRFRHHIRHARRASVGTMFMAGIIPDCSWGLPSPLRQCSTLRMTKIHPLGNKPPGGI